MRLLALCSLVALGACSKNEDSGSVVVIHMQVRRSNRRLGLWLWSSTMWIWASTRPLAPRGSFSQLARCQDSREEATRCDGGGWCRFG